MHFPRFWARGTWRGVDRTGRERENEAWGWSDTSLDDAVRRGSELARKRTESFDPARPPARRYGYPNRPLREPVVREAAAGPVRAVVSRNRCGCEILNTDRAVFVDVDLPAPPRPGFLRSLFGGAGRDAGERTRVEAERIALLDAWQRRHPATSFRVYRTAAGLRYLLTSSAHDPAEPLVEGLLEATGADPAYRVLCRQQQSFRARLTPKPWRCRVPLPPHRHPTTSAGEEDAMTRWLGRYDRAAAGFATCFLLTSLGPGTVAPELAPVLAEHDRATRADSNLPLA